MTEGSRQQAIERIGHEIFARMADAKPAVFSTASATGALLDRAMRGEDLKARLFRLVDVLPSLRSGAEVARHVAEYLGRDAAELPAIAQWAVRAGPRVPWVTAALSRFGVRKMAEAFIVAAEPRKALPELGRIREAGSAFTVDLLGEAAVSEKESGVYAARYLDLIDTLAEAAAGWKREEQLDTDDRGAIPVVNVSVKISALYSQILPAAPEASLDRLTARMRPLLRRARDRGVFVNFDMEMRSLKDLTLTLFKQLLEDDEFRGTLRAGIAMQAYLKETPADLEELIGWAQKQDTRVTVRLVKGAYWDTEILQARQRNWPVPVFECKEETDAAYERLAARMLDCPEVIDCAFGTHNIRSIAACMQACRARGYPDNRIEFQMLYGMAEPVKRALIEMGCRIREYCPIGETLPGMAYLVRRLLENTSNEGFLRATFEEGVSAADLLRDPAEVESAAPAVPPSGFANEPHSDFSRSEFRSAMRKVLQDVRAGFARSTPLRIGNREVKGAGEIVSRNPANPEEIVARVAAAGSVEAEEAVEVAVSAFAMWRDAAVDARAGMIERAADLMSGRRFELAATEVFEVGKTWPEADADVCEAIDFCRYYAEQIRRLGGAGDGVPGEEIRHVFQARGVAAVIAPWNFPLAILCGMTTAALVAGNPVIMKPSAESVGIASLLADILWEAGVPREVLQCLPGHGGEVGAALVEHRDVSVIAFTGSREVGLKIWEAAGRTWPGQAQLKKVVCEMGGKNAVIVDDDADLDEAVPGIVASAFGYGGQKCSALSRLIVFPGPREKLIARLVEATGCLRIGDPSDPSVALGPLINKAAVERVRRYVEIGRREAKLVFEMAAPETGGWFAGPVIFRDVSPGSALAQEEIFGPVLSVIDAADLDEAIRIANDTPYALTGGLYSRSPERIAHVREAFRVGNLYINRGITGALVGRHPFGGFGMSGSGTKAGGAEYLHHFLFPRVVAENVVRRGFAPGV